MSGLNICSLRSSSKGNCTAVFSDTTKILIDCGISCKMTVSALFDIGIMAEEIDAIFVTHEHNDHIRGINLFSKKYNVPVYANSATWTSMRELLPGVSEENVCIIEEEAVKIGDINVCAFAISHDAVNPVGYTMVSGDEKVSVATDTGLVNPSMFDALCGSDKVMIEANHDLNLLAMGSYPDMLKRRIRGDKGHLCNEKAGELALSLFKEGTKKFLLGHLSEENNNPDLAYVTVREMIASCGAKEGIDFIVKMTFPGKTGEVL